MELKIKKLHPDAILPTRANPLDAGLDLYSVEPAILSGNSVLTIRTGIAVEIPPGYVGMVSPRSGLASKCGITVLNAPGIVDAGYTGEVKVILHNAFNSQFVVCSGDKIAQLVIVPILLLNPVWVDELDETERGDKGFGSSG